MNTKNCQILKNSPCSSFFQMHDDFFGYIRGISSVGMVFFFVERDANVFQIEVINKQNMVNLMTPERWSNCCSC